MPPKKQVTDPSAVKLQKTLQKRRKEQERKMAEMFGKPKPKPKKKK